MMVDVEYLRRLAILQDKEAPGAISEALTQAADEIEALRKGVEKVQSLIRPAIADAFSQRTEDTRLRWIGHHAAVGLKSAADIISAILKRAPNGQG